MARAHINIIAGFDLQAFSTSAQNLQNQFTSVGKRLRASALDLASAAAVTLPVSLAGAFSVKEFMDFENQMTKVAAVAEASSGEMARLNDLAMELGETTKFSATQVAGLAFNYSQLGFSVTQIEAITKATLQLSLATGEDLAASAEVAGNTLRGFGYDVSEMQRVVDVMAQSFAMSTLDLERFSVAITKIAPIANQMGFSLEQVTAMMSILSDAGVDASIVGTSLRQIFVQLAKSGMTYDEAMAKIANSTNKVATAVEMFDTRGANAAVMLSESAPKLASFTNALEDSEGAAAKMADTMSNSLQYQVDALKASAIGLAIEFGEQLAPAITTIVGIVKSVVHWFSEMGVETKMLIAAVGVLVVALPPLIVFTAALTTAVTTLGVSFAGLLGPIGLVVGALTIFLGLLKIGVTDQKNFKQHLTETTDVTERLKKVTESYNKNKETALSTLKQEISQLRYSNTTHQERGVLIDKLNAKYGTTIQNLKDEKKFVAQLDSAYKSLSEQIIAKVRISTYEEEIKRIQQEQKKFQDIIKAEEKNVADYRKNLGGMTPLNSGLAENTEAPLKAAQKNLAAVNKELEELTAHIDAIDGKKPILDIEGLSKPITPKEKGAVEKKGDEVIAIWQEKIARIDPLNLPIHIRFNTEQLMDIKVPESASAPIEDLFQIKPYVSKQMTDVQNEYADSWTQTTNGIKNLIENTTVNLASFLGEMLGKAISGSLEKGEFGRGILDTIASFMQQLGALMIAYAVHMALFSQAATNPLEWPIALAAGLGMVAAGAAIKGFMSGGLEGEGYSSGSSAGYSANSANYGGYEWENSIRLEGREMIIVQKRENGFRR